MGALSAAEQAFIEEGIKYDIRSDGRGRYHFRDFSIQVGVIPQANGSARVKLGGTDVIASVKAELGSPRPGRPNLGNIEIAVECSPTAAPEFEGRGGEESNSELSKALQRSLCGGETGAGSGIDLGALMIVDGKVCWDLFIDGLVLGCDGNILDALSIAIKAALSNTGIPSVSVNGDPSSEENTDLDIGDNPADFTHLDTSKVPVIITLTKVGRHYIVDASKEEEEWNMGAAVSIGVGKTGLVSGLTKRGKAGLDVSIISDMISVAKRVSKNVLQSVDVEIAAAESRASESETH